MRHTTYFGEFKFFLFLGRLLFQYRLPVIKFLGVEFPEPVLYLQQHEPDPNTKTLNPRCTLHIRCISVLETKIFEKILVAKTRSR